MPRSKPPRRRYRPLRRIDRRDAKMMTFYDKLEIALARHELCSSPFLDQIPAKERAYVLGQYAEIRKMIAKGRDGVLAPSPTPVLDALFRDGAARRQGAG